ncbi:MAG: hypothetical protein IKU82_03335 [Clostridia bacterium]|nr:hypothetical protein [Clostridia bacterium]
MTNKSLSKVLSIVLTISICVTAICGCVIAANAIDTPEFIIEGSNCNQNDVSASAKVTFNMPEGMGMAAGMFTIDNTNGWYKSVDASLNSELNDASDVVDVRAEDGVVLFEIFDSESSPKLYNTITLKLDFVFKDGGITDTIKIKLTDVELNGIYGDENYTNVADNSTDAYFTIGCQHVYAVSGDPISTSDKYAYSVYNGATCTLCGETKADYQVVPQGDEDGGIVELWDGRDENGAWISWQYSTFEGSGTEEDPYIIKYSEQLAYLTTSSASTYATTVGKYYKVDDSIKAFNMNTTGLDLSGDMTAQEVYNLLNDEVVNRVYWASPTFAGIFDGNGATIYGLHTGHMNYVENGTSKTTEQSAALFPKVTAGAVIKNITLKNSYMYTNSTGAYAGGIIGEITTDAATNNSTADTVYVENCVVHDCYIGSKNTNVAPGVIVCSATSNAYLNISNILVYDNEVSNAKNTIKSVVGVASKCYIPEGATSNVTNNRLIDSVVLGAAPYDANGSWWFKACDQKIFQNVYFDNTIATSGFGNYSYANSKLTQLSSVDAAKGAAAMTNMPDLDWNTNENPDGVWFTGFEGQYPTLLKKTAQTVASGTSNDWKLLGVNIVYADDGSFALNFHYEPKYDSDVKLYIVNAQNENKTKILTEHTVSSFAGTILSNEARMFTLEGISAKDISALWLPTIFTTNNTGDQIVYGETAQISVGDYAESVVMGDAVYSEGATDTQKTADKNVAAALINFCQASNNALSVTTVESATAATVIEKWDQYENGQYVGWYNTNISGEGTKESPYIIDSAEKLAYVCKEVISAGVYYKVADNIKAFDMNTVAGVDLTVDNITANEVKTAVADKILGKVWHPNYSGCFAGNFDGNGVTIYGLYAGPAYYNQASYDSGSKAGCVSGALFSKIDTSTATFKNFTIKNSYFTGGNCGAVFAETTLSGGSAKIDNVIVANCYIESTGGTGGAIGGYCKSKIDDTNKIYTLDTVVLNNCLVYDNVVSNSNGVAPRLIGSIQAWHWNGSSKVIDPNYCSFNNIIAIDCNIFESTSWWSSQKGLFSKCYTTETNIYYNTTITDITQLSNADAAKGIAAKTNMPALDWETVWMYGDEGEYPSIVLTEGNQKKLREQLVLEAKQVRVKHLFFWIQVSQTLRATHIL